jgi:hypothetical protein
VTAPAHPLDSVKAVPPTFTGTVPIQVDGETWGVAPGSRLHREAKGPDRYVFVLTPERKVHMLGVRGGKVVEFVGSPAVASRMTMLALQEWFE